ncbi:MAG: hypothetical protein IJH83_05125, partial [Coriobacteriales bacterium]|nr:hypothetical protein [Coriobacteriales bacterium]
MVASAPCRVHPCASEPMLRRCTAQVLGEAAGEDRRYLIVPQLDSIDPWRRYLANVDQQLTMGLKVLTVDEFVKENWALLGDGRSMVTARKRRVLLAELLCKRENVADDCPFSATHGTVQVLVNAIQGGFGIPAFDALLDDPQGESEGMRWVWRILAQYRQRLRDLGLAEKGEMLAALPSLIPDCYHIVMTGFPELNAVEQRFVRDCVSDLVLMGDPRHAANACILKLLQRLETLGCTITEPVGDMVEPSWQSPEIFMLLERLYQCKQPLPPMDGVRFACSGGVYSQVPLLLPMIADEIERGIDPARILVASPRVNELFSRLGPRLAQLGIASQGECRLAFAETVFGAAFSDLVERQDIRQLISFLYSPFSGANRRLVRELDRAWRGCRTAQADLDACMASACFENSRLASIFEAAKARDYLALIELLAPQDLPYDLSYQHVETQAAVKVARRFFQDAQGHGLSLDAIRELLYNEPVDFAYAYRT